MLIFGEKFLEGVSLKQIHPAFPVSLPFAINGKKGLATDGERGRKGGGERMKGQARERGSSYDNGGQVISGRGKGEGMESANRSSKRMTARLASFREGDMEKNLGILKKIGQAKGIIEIGFLILRSRRV